MTKVHSVSFRVPNTPVGRLFINQARNFINRDRYAPLVVCNRGPHRQNEDTPRDRATGFALYLNPSKAAKEENFLLMDKNYIARWQHEDDMNNLFQIEETKRNDLRDVVAIREQTIDHLRKSNKRYSKSNRYWMYTVFFASLAGIALGYFINA